MSTKQITVTTTIGTEGTRCWMCSHGPASGPLCELFGKRRTMSPPGAPWSRLLECLEAEQKPAASPWQPIETAPKTGEHILAAIFGAGCGFGGPNDQAHCMVVHYWSNPGEEGFYPSNGPDKAYPATHWRPLESDQRNTEAR